MNKKSLQSILNSQQESAGLPQGKIPCALKNKGAGDVHFCSHFGTSMNPTLSEFDLLEIEPYGKQPIRVGDVIFFIPSGWNRPAVHRVMCVAPNGILTRGDNNNLMDSWIVFQDSVVGRVMRATRGKRTRPVYGGFAGRMWAIWVEIFKVFMKFPSFVYHFLARSGLVRCLVPLDKRIRIISISQPSGAELQLLLGRLLVGRRKSGMNQWWIQRPFRLFIDESFLPRQGYGRTLNQERHY